MPYSYLIIARCADVGHLTLDHMTAALDEMLFCCVLRLL